MLRDPHMKSVHCVEPQSVTYFFNPKAFVHTSTKLRSMSDPNFDERVPSLWTLRMWYGCM